MEDAFQKLTVPSACALLVDLVYAPCCPCMHRRIYVPQSPFISGYLSVGMHVPLAEHQRELFFCEVRVDQGKRNAVECQVPSRIPRVLPLVWHGNHVSVVQVSPLMIASLPSLLGWAWVVRVASQPILDDVMIELLGPEHPRKALAHDVLRVCGEILRNDRRVKFFRLTPPERECFVEGVKRVLSFEVRVGKPHPYYNRLT